MVMVITIQFFLTKREDFSLSLFFFFCLDFAVKIYFYDGTTSGGDVWTLDHAT